MCKVLTYALARTQRVVYRRIDARALRRIGERAEQHGVEIAQHRQWIGSALEAQFQRQFFEHRRRSCVRARVQQIPVLA